MYNLLLEFQLGRRYIWRFFLRVLSKDTSQDVHDVPEHCR
jgi:hypothetical protein